MHGKGRHKLAALPVSMRSQQSSWQFPSPLERTCFLSVGEETKFRKNLADSEGQEFGAAPPVQGLRKAHYVSVPVSSWNLAGAGKKKVKGIIATVFVAVQEYPKQSLGWHIMDHGRMNAVLYQDVMMYRAVGVMYDSSKFRVRKRKHSVRGVWVLLEMVDGGQEIWIGSLHLPVNEVIEEVHRLLDEFMEALPATDKPALLLGDMNTHTSHGGCSKGWPYPRASTAGGANSGR